MPILPIYVYDQPVLRRRAKPVRGIDGALTKLTEDMFETMHGANGIGLAANQVGSLQRIVVVDLSVTEEWKDTKPLILLNPEVVRQEGEVTMEEGCLSLPDIRDEVDRAETITVRFLDLEFRQQELTASGLLARVCMHEIDHLNGVLFFDHLGPLKRKLLNGRLNRLKSGDMEVDYPVVGAIYVPADPAVPKGPPSE